jgi:hypothetical protein
LDDLSKLNYIGISVLLAVCGDCLCKAGPHQKQNHDVGIGQLVPDKITTQVLVVVRITLLDTVYDSESFSLKLGNELRLELGRQSFLAKIKFAKLLLQYAG